MKPKGKVLGKSRDFVLTSDQRGRLRRLTTGQGGNQSLFRKLEEGVRTVDGRILMRVYDVDRERLLELAARGDTGGWQDWAREVLAANP